MNMKWFIQYFISIMIIYPMIPFLLIFMICKSKQGTQKAFRIASDVTTFILLFTVPIMIKGIWEFHYTWLIFVVLLIIGIIFTYIDWRKKKEIEIFSLLKKIWRFYFIFLAFLFILIWIIGLIISIIEYVYG